MSSPIDPARLEQLRAMLTAPNMRDKLLPNRAPIGRQFTYDEALAWFENMAQALHNTPRLPVDVTITRDDDGSMTLRVTPQQVTA